MTQLEKTIGIFKSMTNPSWEGFYVYGSIKVDNFLKSFVKDYAEDLEIELEDAEGSIISNEDIDQYENIQIKFLPARKKFSFFAKNFDDYLLNFDFLFKKPDEFYISDIDGLYNGDSTSNICIEAYCKIIELYELLLRVADHTEKDDFFPHKHIILSVSGKDEILVSYNSGDIERLSKYLSDVQVKSIEEELFSGLHKAAKLSLFKKAIAQYLSGNKDATKFSLLIERFPEVVKSYENNCELFLSEFSFEDEKEKLEKNKQEYLLKLNEILSGIHGKLLAIPISLVIVAGQMKPLTIDNYFLINFIILAGAVLFALLMWMLTANQLHSLLAVKTEYTSKKERLKIQLRGSLYEELSQAFIQLDERFMHQRRMICLIYVLVILVFLLSIFVFAYHMGYIESLFKFILLNTSAIVNSVQ